MKKFVIVWACLQLALATTFVKIEEDPRQEKLPFGWKSLGSAEGIAFVPCIYHIYQIH
jgi:hypothetical protein